VITVSKRHKRTDGQTDGQTDNILWHNCAVRSTARSPPKSLNEDRFILLEAKCRPMILVFSNVKYMWIFAGVPRQGRKSSNDSNGLALHPLILTCALLPVCLTVRHTGSSAHVNILTWPRLSGVDPFPC